MLDPRRLLWLPLPLLALPATALAQGGSLALETNRFYSEQGRTLIEGAVEIPYTLMTFQRDGETLRARANVEVIVEKSDGESVYNTSHEITAEAFNEAMAGSDRVSTIETFAIYAPAGEYTTKARVTDQGSGRSFEVTTPLVIPATPPLISDMLMASQVRKDVRLQEGSYLPYLIGTTMYNPNPRRVFYRDSPMLYFYYEVNPEALPTPHESVALDMRVKDASGEVVKDLGKRTITVSEDRNFDIGAFSVAGLRPGSYQLEVTCEDCGSGLSSSSPFAVMPPHTERLTFLEPEAAAAQDPALQYYADLSAAQVDSVIAVMELFLTPAQQQLVGTLNETGKKQFLNRFLESADPNPETPENEFKQAVEQRVAYANQFFTSSQNPGFRTDRGRIYMVFGPPTEVIDKPVEATVGPYVIWNYTNQGETFAFGDFRKDGSYQLIYSTDERFISDPSIQSLVDTDSGTSSPTFLRAGRGYETIILDIRQHRTGTGDRQ
ncbi:MAG TPA: GWxTD domain-containing protein [Gemmatimonadota bacterium]|nr:GWxTD domain-containing protein [Gemmatimonadota bacterium]